MEPFLGGKTGCRARLPVRPQDEGGMPMQEGEMPLEGGGMIPMEDGGMPMEDGVQDGMQQDGMQQETEGCAEGVGDEYAEGAGDDKENSQQAPEGGVGDLGAETCAYEDGDYM